MTAKRDNLIHLLDKVVLGRTIFTPPFKASSALENEARFVHVVHGSSRLYSPNNQFDLHTGDSLLMKCENFVNNWLENEDGTQNEVIIIHFYPDVLRLIYDEKVPAVFTSAQASESKPIEKIPQNQMIENFVQSLRLYFNNPGLVTDDLIKVKIKELILILVNSDRSGQLKSILGELFRTKEYEFKEIIHSHLFEDLGIQDLAFFAGMSLSSFKRKFKAVFGTSPTQYIKGKRLEKAKDLLRNPNLRISDVAYDCGFNDLGYFSKTFHTAFSCSPSEYRKQLLS